MPPKSCGSAAPALPFAFRSDFPSASLLFGHRPINTPGIALVIVVAVVFTLSAMALGLAAYLQADQRDVRLHIATVQAEYAAESGIEKLRFLLEQDGPPIARQEKLGEADLELLANDASPTRLTALATVGEVAVRVTAQAFPVSTGQGTIYQVKQATVRKVRLSAAP